MMLHSTYHKFNGSWICRLLPVLAVFFLLSGTANAALFSEDLYTAGDGLITFDDATGLEWLDLTETLNMSRTSVLAELGSGGQFEGWRYASTAETTVLWQNFGLTMALGQYSLGAGMHPTISDSISFFGDTYANDPGSAGVSGMTSDFYLGQFGSVFYHFVYDWYYGANDKTLYGIGGINSGAATPVRGSYLVREGTIDPVPEPATMLLLGSGLIGMAGIGRKKFKK